MTIKIVGSRPKIKRLVTGLYTLDRACTNDLGEIGIPIGTGYEIFGLTGTGKSTLCYSLAGIIGRELKGNIVLSDFEGYDEVFFIRVLTTQGFDGVIHSTYDKIDEKQLDKLVELMNEKENVVSILDSIGAVAPLAETKGDIGDRNMGGRGFIMAQFSRQMIKLFRSEENKVLFMTNHWYPKLGSYGYTTPGGEVKKYLATVRIKLERIIVDKTGGKKHFPDGSYVLLGTVAKNRWGYQDRTFNIFVLAGLGVHIGMTALWDCVALKLAKYYKTQVFIGKESIGKLGHFAKAAKQGETEVFAPFHKLLEEYNGKDTTEDIGEEGADDANADSEEGSKVDN